jgi:hypothetical protein
MVESGRGDRPQFFHRSPPTNPNNSPSRVKGLAGAD